MVADAHAQKDFTAGLISFLASMKVAMTHEQIEGKARQFAEISEFKGDLALAIEEALVAIDTRMGIGVSLVDVQAKHDEEWVRKRQITPTYADAYEAFLKQEKWSPDVVRSLSDVGTRILGHLQDPLSEGEWKRRGLVIGHVQSGKTANYLGLVAKAADAGYRFIVVIAGIHNNLRKQTQERVDEGFIGRSSDPLDHKLLGVGLGGAYPHPVTLTNINDDFSKATAAKAGWKIDDFSKPLILVIKKNTKTLEALHRWLKELNAQGDGTIRSVPMLMIDDEADNASINTNKPDLDPTRTNRLLRQILSLFSKSCYVGYTATPFANIFINHEAYDPEVRDDLFPRDFIYSLDAPTSYFGPDKVFLNDATSDRILEPIIDAEEYLPLEHKRDYAVADLPPSLYGAVNEFLIARAIRNVRGHRTQHCSMLINASRFVAVQRTIRNFISEYIKVVGEAVKANYAMPEASSSRNRHMTALRTTFDEHYSDRGVTWDQVKAELWGVFEHLKPFVINSKSDEPLDFKKYKDAGVGLTAITIGGLSLSRGLTIEGLTVSYMYRNTAMYDTLMQMGRWFGYRPGYEDICRVHLAPASIDWYGKIAEASEELRQQIRQMRRDGLSPWQFGLYVQAHPESLLVTARNKMRSATQVTLNQNFTNQLIESTWLPLDANTSQDNEALIKEFWQDGFGGIAAEVTRKGWAFNDVQTSTLIGFLGRFQAHSRFAPRRTQAVEYLAKIEEQFPYSDVLLISKGDGPDLGPYALGTQDRNKRPADTRSWHAAQDRVASRGDEKLGLTGEQQAIAAAFAEEDEPGKEPSDTHYRRIRNKPLLMVHMLSLFAAKEGDARFLAPAVGVSFPPDLYGVEIEIVANQVWLQSMQPGPSDDPDDEDDFDE